MAFDEAAAHRIREILSGQSTEEKKMFGGIAFMVQDHMCVGINGSTLMVRVGPENHEQALSKPHARPMDFTGRPMKGFVFVDPDGFKARKDLESWIELGLSFVSSLPPKKRR